MVCIKCGKGIPEDAVFCHLCGKKQVTEQRKHKKRANGTGNISKLSGKRSKPYVARKNGISIGTFATRIEAQKALERLTDVSVSDNYNLIFAQVYERWYAEHSRKVSESMSRGYAISFKHCPGLHDKPIRKILRSDYQAAVIALEQKGMSKSSCNKLRVLLGMVGRYAMEEGITLNNPAEGLSTIAKQKKTKQVFDEEKISAIKQSTLPAADVALILISCGCTR
jgi:hypothetical protein